jgi:site-specific DNA-methyltransferase (adenine-specific)
MPLNIIQNQDCYNGIDALDENSIDLILTDPPYNTTANSWESDIDLALLWKKYNRVIKESGTIIFTASQPFTTKLINSNPDMFRYCLVWDKVGTTGFVTASVMPLRRHEDIVLFYKKSSTYNPIMEKRGKARKKGGSNKDNGCYGQLRSKESFNNDYYPTSIIQVSNASKSNLIHPTQKPVDLFSYLIKTYSNEGDVVLDTFSGSGTTAIACLETKRKYICFENNQEYYEKSLERIKQWHEAQKTIFDI